MKEGVLTLPFSSSILVVETPEEILTDKLRALYERPYLKGRDSMIFGFPTMLGPNVLNSWIGSSNPTFVPSARFEVLLSFWKKNPKKNYWRPSGPTFDVFSRLLFTRFLKLQPLPRSFKPWKKSCLLLSKTDWKIC
jgi:hypothetical protein